jgi:hypothetical protein
LTKKGIDGSSVLAETLIIDLPNRDCVSDTGMVKFSWGRPELDPEKIWLTSGYRVMLIKEGIDKAGSINKLGRELGYRSRVHPGWSIRQILLGYQPFPIDRLRLLASFLDKPVGDILEHQTRPKAVTPESTRDALRRYGLIGYYPR